MEIQFKTAKLAKEKKFETHIANFNKAYNQDGVKISLIEIANSPNKYKNEGYQIVEQVELQNWLLKEHSIYVYPHTAFTQNFKDDKMIYSFKPSIEILKPVEENTFYVDLKYKLFHGLPPMSFEEAFELGLQEALKLIN